MATSPDPLSPQERLFVERQRVGHLATADRMASPHVVPVCYALADRALYVTIDDKPKRLPDARLKRLRNIAENPAAAVVVDRYDEDWSRLGWVMLRGTAEILASGPEHGDAQARLVARYPQLAAMAIARHPCGRRAAPGWGRSPPVMAPPGAPRVCRT